ncbi:MAG: cupin domain-containing protein [Halobacteriota archaeon]
MSDNFSKWSSPSRSVGAETVAVSHVTLQPGESGPMHAHEPPIEEFYVALEGVIEIDVFDPESEAVETMELAEGQLAYFPPGVYKQPVNRSDEVAVELRFGSVTDAGETETTVAEEY